MQDLNKVRVQIADLEPKQVYSELYGDNSVRNINAGVSIFFEDIENEIISKIQEYESGLILGCVAWLTSFRILDALAKCRKVQMLVQKEDFLRPDTNNADVNNWAKELREKYSKLNFDYTDRLSMHSPLNRLSVAWSGIGDNIRCVGNHNSERLPAMPRMHNKFMVFCEVEFGYEEGYEYVLKYTPKEVITGSYNFTKNAGASKENIVLIKSEEIAEQYKREHHQIFAISEPLNWEDKWCTPEYRIGT